MYRRPRPPGQSSVRFTVPLRTAALGLAVTARCSPLPAERASLASVKYTARHAFAAHAALHAALCPPGLSFQCAVLHSSPQ